MVGEVEGGPSAGHEARRRLGLQSPERPELEELLRASAEAVRRMDPFERALMAYRQRRSFARGSVGLSRPDPSREEVDRHVESSDECVLVDGLLSRLEDARREIELLRSESLVQLRRQRDDLQAANEAYRRRALAAEGRLVAADGALAQAHAALLAHHLSPRGPASGAEGDRHVTATVTLPVSPGAEDFVTQLSRIEASRGGPAAGSHMELLVSPSDLERMERDGRLLLLWDRQNPPGVRGRDGYRGTLLGFTVRLLDEGGQSRVVVPATS